MGITLTFGEWLEDRIKDHGWTISAFADSIDVARQTVGEWIKGARRPHRRTCRDIARVLRVDEDEVLVRAGYPPKAPDYVLPEDRQATPDNEQEPRVSYSAEDVLLNTWKEALERVKGFPLPYRGFVPADSSRYGGYSERGEMKHVPESWVQGVRDLFTMTVSGDCLEAIGINSGDIVICKEYHGQPIPAGSLVVVWLGEQITLKRWYVVQDGVELRDGIGTVTEFLTDSLQPHVEGIVIGHYREFTRL